MRRFELDDLVNRPGTYFNPQTEVLIVVDDSPDLDNEIFDLEEAEGADWVLISDEAPVDEHTRDDLIERFQARHSAAATGDDLAEPDEADADEDFDGFEVQDPDEDEPLGRPAARRSCRSRRSSTRRRSLVVVDDAVFVTSVAAPVVFAASVVLAASVVAAAFRPTSTTARSLPLP